MQTECESLSLETQVLTADTVVDFSHLTTPEELAQEAVRLNSMAEGHAARVCHHRDQALVHAWMCGHLLEHAAFEMKRRDPGYYDWLEDTGISRQTAERWRKLSKVPRAELLEMGSKSAAYKALDLIDSESRTPTGGGSSSDTKQLYGWAQKITVWVGKHATEPLGEDEAETLRELRDKINARLGE